MCGFFGKIAAKLSGAYQQPTGTGTSCRQGGDTFTTQSMMSSNTVETLSRNNAESLSTEHLPTLDEAEMFFFS
jgi:hypothetical protein